MSTRHQCNLHTARDGFARGLQAQAATTFAGRSINAAAGREWQEHGMQYVAVAVVAVSARCCCCCCYCSASEAAVSCLAEGRFSRAPLTSTTPTETGKKPWVICYHP